MKLNIGKTTLWRGRDSREFDRLRAALDEAKIRHFDEKFDESARLMLQQTSIGPSGGLKSHNGAMNAQYAQIEKAAAATQDYYTIDVHRRNLTKARQCI